MADELKESVSKWLAESGFPLELRVAAAMRGTGLEVRQGDYYTDPRQPEKRREIDVVVGRRARGRRDVLVEVAIECKTSTKPWVVFSKSAPRGFETWPASAAYASPKAAAVEYGHAGLMRTGPRAGFSVRTAFTKSGDRDGSYDAVSQATAYARSVVHDQFRLPDDTRPERRVVLPCVVLDGHLFEATLARNGELDVVQISQAALEWRQTKSRHGFHAVVIATAGVLEGFARVVGEWIQDVSERLEHND